MTYQVVNIFMKKIAKLTSLFAFWTILTDNRRMALTNASDERATDKNDRIY